jgi:hypothetical protein
MNTTCGVEVLMGFMFALPLSVLIILAVFYTMFGEMLRLQQHTFNEVKVTQKCLFPNITGSVSSFPSGENDVATIFVDNDKVFFTMKNKDFVALGPTFCFDKESIKKIL